MRKVMYIIVMCLLMTLVNTISVVARQDYIERKILTDISWYKFEEGTSIHVHYMSISKFANNETVVEPWTEFITVTDLQYEGLTREKVDQLIMEPHFSISVFYDKVYGNYLRIFDDVYNNEEKRDELDDLIEEAIKEVNYFYEHREQIISGEIDLSENYEVYTPKNPMFEMIIVILGTILVIAMIMSVLDYLNRKKRSS